MAIGIETVHTDTFDMDYFRFGSGEKTFVILPGLSVQSVMGSADAIATAYAAWADDFTVYVFDRRKVLPSSYAIRDMAEDTALAFRQLGLHDVCLFGASQGGMIGLAMAVYHPELVGKLALGSTSAHVKPGQLCAIEKWISLAKRKDTKGLYLSFGEEIYPPAFFDKCRDTLLAAADTVTEEELERFIILAEGIRDFDITGELRSIRCSVLAIGSLDDRVLDSDATMEIAKILKGTNFHYHMYSGFGHASFDTAPDYLDRLYRFYTS
ncbi:MAG: alpha/beta hydrolase [Lachnospiraceae bacterium]|nr:alpha/beta hydrolase [Lachnospiraceae bacterium]